MKSTTKRILNLLLLFIIIALIFHFAVIDAQAQTATNFTPQDNFSIPALNGTINFATNGSYTSATLVNGSWIFSNLSLNNSKPLGNLTVSAVNSNMTILLYRFYNLLGRTAILRYYAQGIGTQTVNLGLNVTQQTQPIEWSVSPTAGVFLAEGNGWKLLRDNSVVVTGLTGNITVLHYGFFAPTDNNLPFYQHHSIAILTTIVFAALVTIAVIIRVKERR
ncbi:MAG TPA: hypothetical protein VK253_02095 [Candidatus Binatia bacterium]|nr:hypothetical protein [Candidatus Binatia bacterium]